MRMLKILFLLSPIALAACGSDTHEKTVVVNPPQASAPTTTSSSSTTTTTTTCPTAAPC